MKIKNPRDFWAGIMFIGFGVFAMIGARMNYELGTAMRMGPGYFPAVLGAVLAVLGVLIVIVSVAVTGSKVNRFYFRPLFFILVSCLAFAYLLRPLGVILAIVALVFISAYGGHEYKFKEVAILAGVMIVFSLMVFVKGLTLPFPIWPTFMK